MPDETADNPGVQALMRYLAANHPKAGPGPERWDIGDRVRHKLTKHAGTIVASDLGRVGVRWNHDPDWRHWYEPADLEHTSDPNPTGDGEMMTALGRVVGVEPTAFVQHGDMAVELPGIEPERAVDLMEALERSISEAKAARRRSTDG